MNNYLKGVISRLEFDLSQAADVVTACESKLRDAKKLHYDTSKMLEGYKSQAAVEERIEELGIRTTAFDLVRRTLTRCKANAYLRNGNQRIGSAYYRISTLVRSGAMPKYAISKDGVHNELRAIGWCRTILSYDNAEKSVRLSSDLNFENGRLNDELANRREVS